MTQPQKDMTEKEKAAAGLMYNPNTDAELIAERDAAKTLLQKYNNLAPSEKDARREILKKLLGETGENFIIEQPFYCDYGYNISIGENFYANFGLSILDAAKVTFGKNAFIGPNVGIYAAGHPLDAKERNTLIEYAKPIAIGDNVWIGGDVTIVPGVSIGDNCVIGAGSVVTKDIPPNTLAAGNPCRPIKKI